MKSVPFIACWRAASIALAVLLASACSNVDEALVPAELTALESTAFVKSEWHTPLDGNARINGIGPFKSGQVYSRPIFVPAGGQYFKLAIKDDVLFAVTKKGHIFAVNKNTGKPVWHVDLDRELSTGLGLFGDSLYTATPKGDVIALSVLDGKVQWTTTVSTEVVAAPQSNGKQVLVKAIDGRLFGLDAETGKKLWNYDHPQPLLTFRAQSAPLVVGQQAFVAFDNGQLMNFGTAEGDLRWSARVSQPKGVTELERTVDLDVTPLESGPFVLSAGANGRIAAISRGTGKISWAEDASVFNEIALNDDAVFYVDDNSHVHARRILSGQSLWDSKVLHRRGVGSPSVVGNYVAAIDDSNFLHIFDATTGELAARKALRGNGFNSPILVDGYKIYIFSDNGSLSSYRVVPKQPKD
ncbi:MAG: outer membrane protein assembly factor BamB [Marinagarivorans sp.]|nr:outer membrane protein assembly factor BamB [Marinagarivorans sp.]